MSSLPDRRLGLLTQGELRSASSWVWVLLALAAIDFVLLVIATSRFGLSALSSSLTAAMPAVLAATLMLVAPRERLVRIAALGFAVPVAVNAVRVAFSSDLIASATSNSDYALLVPRVLEWVDGFSSVSWLFSGVAILALALYIGTVRTRGGWFIVGASALLAVAQFAVGVTQMAPLFDPELASGDILVQQIVLKFFVDLVTVAWGYLLAVTYERRLTWLATAAALRLIIPAVGLVGIIVSLPALNSPNPVQDLLITVSSVLGLAFWVMIIAGVLRELPRHGTARATSDSPSAQEAFSLGR